MRTSLNEIKLIDDHLFNNSDAGDKLLFEAKLIIDDSLPDKVICQKNAHTVIQQYSRKKLKAEIETVHQRLFTEPKHRAFRQIILSFFK